MNSLFEANESILRQAKKESALSQWQLDSDEENEVEPHEEGRQDLGALDAREQTTFNKSKDSAPGLEKALEKVQVVDEDTVFRENRFQRESFILSDEILAEFKDPDAQIDVAKDVSYDDEALEERIQMATETLNLANVFLGPPKLSNEISSPGIAPSLSKNQSFNGRERKFIRKGKVLDTNKSTRKALKLTDTEESFSSDGEDNPQQLAVENNEDDFKLVDNHIKELKDFSIEMDELYKQTSKESRLSRGKFNFDISKISLVCGEIKYGEFIKAKEVDLTIFERIKEEHGIPKIMRQCSIKNRIVIVTENHKLVVIDQYD